MDPKRMPRSTSEETSDSPENRDKRYLQIAVGPIRVCADYRPRLGKGPKAGLSLTDFQSLYRTDPFYSWFGLDNALVYAAHKAAGGMTSIYRQIGIGCEHLFRAVLQDELGLSDEQSSWSYTTSGRGGKTRTLALDARIPLADVRDPNAHRRIQDWMQAVCRDLDVNRKVSRSLEGVVFEVRQGYKSKDSKRQNADIANAATAYSQAYLPCAALFSLQIDEDVFVRYRSEKWAILTGRVKDGTVLDSTYRFMHCVVGYDLAGFFQRHVRKLQAEVNRVLEVLLNVG